MSQQVINVGTLPDDQTGDQARLAFQKVNANFTELYNNTPLVSVIFYGADSTGVLSSTAAFNAAAAASLYVYIPPGTYKIDGQVLCNARGVTFVGAARGATTLVLSTSTDAFKWSGSGAGGGMQSLTLNVAGMTGGYAINTVTQGRMLFSDMNVINSNTAAGAFFFQDFNSMSMRDIWINGSYGTNGTAIYIFGLTASSANVIDIDNVVYGGSGGASSTSSYGIIVDGGVATVDIRHFSAVACYRGLVTLNTPALANFSQFIQATDFQVDGCYGDAVVLGTAGAGSTTGHTFNQLYVHHPGQNNAGSGIGNGTGVYIFSNVRAARFQGGDILTCNLGGMYINGSAINVSDMCIRKNSQLSVGTLPGIQLGVASFGCNIHNNLIGQLSGAATSDMSYGVQLDAGAIQNIVAENYLLLNTLGAILNSAGDTNSIIRNNLYAGNQEFGSALGPTAMAATVNNYNPTGWSTSGMNVTRLRLTPAGGGTTINGLFTGASATLWLDGVVVLIRNLSTADSITFTHLNGGSNAWNQFNLPGAASLVLAPLASRQFMYDGIESKGNAV